MRTVPKGRARRITWYKVRMGKWAQDPSGIGSSPAEIAALADLVEEARLARIAQARANIAARCATSRLNSAIERMSNAGASVVLKVRAKATASGDNSVYGKAYIAPPRKASPIGTPGRPHSFGFDLQQDGWGTLVWKCDNPKGATGTMYHVRRQLEGSGEFVFLGPAGKKKFVDKTLPAGVKMVIYEVQAIRTTASGQPGTHLVRFGGAAVMATSLQKAAA